MMKLKIRRGGEVREILLERGRAYRFKVEEGQEFWLERDGHRVDPESLELAAKDGSLVVGGSKDGFRLVLDGFVTLASQDSASLLGGGQKLADVVAHEAEAMLASELLGPEAGSHSDSSTSKGLLAAGGLLFAGAAVAGFMGANRTASEHGESYVVHRGEGHRPEPEPKPGTDDAGKKDVPRDDDSGSGVPDDNDSGVTVPEGDQKDDGRKDDGQKDQDHEDQDNKDDKHKHHSHDDDNYEDLVFRGENVELRLDPHDLKNVPKDKDYKLTGVYKGDLEKVELLLDDGKTVEGTIDKDKKTFEVSLRPEDLKDMGGSEFARIKGTFKGGGVAYTEKENIEFELPADYKAESRISIDGDELFFFNDAWLNQTVKGSVSDDVPVGGKVALSIKGETFWGRVGENHDFAIKIPKDSWHLFDSREIELVARVQNGDDVWINSDPVVAHTLHHRKTGAGDSRLSLVLDSFKDDGRYTLTKEMVDDPDFVVSGYAFKGDEGAGKWNLSLKVGEVSSNVETDAHGKFEARLSDAQKEWLSKNPRCDVELNLKNETTGDERELVFKYIEDPLAQFRAPSDPDAKLISFDPVDQLDFHEKLLNDGKATIKGKAYGFDEGESIAIKIDGIDFKTVTVDKDHGFGFEVENGDVFDYSKFRSYVVSADVEDKDGHHFDKTGFTIDLRKKLMLDRIDWDDKITLSQVERDGLVVSGRAINYHDGETIHIHLGNQQHLAKVQDGHFRTIVDSLPEDTGTIRVQIVDDEGLTDTRHLEILQSEPERHVVKTNDDRTLADFVNFMNSWHHLEDLKDNVWRPMAPTLFGSAAQVGEDPGPFRELTDDKVIFSPDFVNSHHLTYLNMLRSDNALDYVNMSSDLRMIMETQKAANVMAYEEKHDHVIDDFAHYDPEAAQGARNLLLYNQIGENALTIFTELNPIFSTTFHAELLAKTKVDDRGSAIFSSADSYGGMVTKGYDGITDDRYSVPETIEYPAAGFDLGGDYPRRGGEFPNKGFFWRKHWNPDLAQIKISVERIIDGEVDATINPYFGLVGMPSPDNDMTDGTALEFHMPNVQEREKLNIKPAPLDKISTYRITIMNADVDENGDPYDITYDVHSFPFFYYAKYVDDVYSSVDEDGFLKEVTDKGIYQNIFKFSNHTDFGRDIVMGYIRGDDYLNSKMEVSDQDDVVKIRYVENSQIYALDGDDRVVVETLNGTTVDLGAGDDSLTVRHLKSSHVTGGEGLDVLKVMGDGETLDSMSISGVEFFDLKDGHDYKQTLTLDFGRSDLISSDRNELVVLGDKNDVVKARGAKLKSEVPTDGVHDGHEVKVFEVEYGDRVVELKIDSDIWEQNHFGVL